MSASTSSLGASCCCAPRAAAALRARRACRGRAPTPRGAYARRGGDEGGEGSGERRPAAPGTSSSPSSLPALASELSRALGQLGSLFPPPGGAAAAGVDPAGACAPRVGSVRRGCSLHVARVAFAFALALCSRASDGRERHTRIPRLFA
jgi:hypothetical protein